MRQFVIRVRAAPKGAGIAADAEVASFDTQEDAEYFMSLAAKLHALRQCDLAVARVDAGPDMGARSDAAPRASSARHRSG